MVAIIEKPKVSVIIPTYNRADILPRTINSVLGQTFKGFELIIVDDGSIDETRKIINSFQEKDNRIKYVWQKNSGAPSGAKNRGIKEARGDFLAFLDDDDEWLPEKLKEQLDIFTRSRKIGIVGCNGWDIYVDQNNLKKEYIIKRPKDRRDAFLKILERCFIHSSSSVVIPKFVFERVGPYDESFKASDDWDLYIRILAVYNFEFVGKPLFNHYIHGGNISGGDNYLLSTREHEKILSKHSDFYKKHPKRKTRIIRCIGSNFMQAGDTSEARRYYLKAINCSPFHLNNYLYLIVSFFGVRLFRKIYKQAKMFLPPKLINFLRK